MEISHGQYRLINSKISCIKVELHNIERDVRHKLIHILLWIISS